MDPLYSDVEHQLKQSRESLDFALKSGRMGTWDINLETRTIQCSKEMLEIWGVSAEEFNGQRSVLQSKVHPDDLQRMNDAINAAIHSDHVYELEYRILPSPGIQKWVMSRGRCTFAPHSPIAIRFAGVVFDITDKKAKEEALDAAIKSRDQFYMIAGHELKTPLTCLQLQMQVIEFELKQKFPGAYASEKIGSGLKKQQEHLLRISRIIDNVLDESKISEGRLKIQTELFNLCEMASEVIDRFKVIAESSGVEVQFHCTQKVLGTWDSFRIEQVLLNLLINAIRYGKNKPIYVEVTKDEENAMLIVRDQGIGISSEDQPRVFERFERVISENKISGIGLGLFISHNIVQAHRGKILLKSKIDEGSEFTVILPLK